ncbi:MAG: antiterminator LoaP [Clostridia bacterium]
MTQWSEQGENRWHALFVKTGSEEKIKESLEARLGDVFRFCVPRRVLIIRKGGKNTREIKPLFPGYILLYGPMTLQSYHLIKGTGHVYYLLMNDCRPMVIPEEEILPIQALMGNQEGGLIGESIGFMENDRIFVREGPLKAMEGSILSVNARKGRAKVRLFLGGEEKLVDLSLHVINRG